MSKMGQAVLEMNEKRDNEKDSKAKGEALLEKVSATMHEAEQRIDTGDKIDVVKSKRSTKKEGIITGTITRIGDTKEEKDELIVKKIHEFINKTHNVVAIDGKTYVKVGVYQYLASLLGIVPTFKFDENSTDEYVWCTCILKTKKDGEELSRAAMFAEQKENFLYDKPSFAVLGMAQTRAFVRAMKNIYGYLIELAGYQSVASEEISTLKSK